MGAKSLVLAISERRQAMKQQDVYMAKEAFTFPLFCVACMAVNIYWDCTDGWSVGASVGTSFFGIVVLFYVGKYLHFGRNYLKINANGIEIKELGKTTAIKWPEIEKCEVNYRTTFIAASFFARDLYIVTKPKNKQKQYVNVSLSGKAAVTKALLKQSKDSAVQVYSMSNLPIIKTSI